jgi:5-methylcytosine-specific restriction endonuclease McrA
MNTSRPKQGRIRVCPKAYEQIRHRVLQRDRWRCQVCGSRKNLQVHHIQLRSQFGNDAEENLVTLCAGCHIQVHAGTRKQN